MTGGILPYASPNSVQANKNRKDLIKKEIKFNVIRYDFNKKDIEEYDIFPYLCNCYKERKNKPKTFEEFKKFILEEARYQWWSRCEYELIVNGFPETKDRKIDIYYQIQMNIDIITNLFMKYIKNK